MVRNLIMVIATLFFISCSKDLICEFECNYGHINAKQLTYLIEDFESKIMKKYHSKDISEAYKMFVKEYEKNKISPEIIFSEYSLEILENKGFLASFYGFRSDGSTDQFSLFIHALSSLDLDLESIQHVDFLEETGGHYDYSLVSHFFSEKADYNNYFHKRFCFLYFYIYPPEFCFNNNSEIVIDEPKPLSPVVTD